MIRLETTLMLYFGSLVVAFSVGWAIAEFKYRNKYKDWATKKED